MGQIITISGQRGGIGKTLIAVNLASGLALYEKKTLLVDCDPRAVATQWMTLPKIPNTLVSFLSEESNFPSTVMSTDLSHLDIIPSGFELFFGALKLSKLTSNEALLKKILHSKAFDEYEYIIIDSPSSWGYLPLLAHTAADFLICPVIPKLTSNQDFECLFKMLGYIRNTHKTTVKIAGFLTNFCDSINEVSTSSWYESFEEFRDLIFETPIPRSELLLPLILNDAKDKTADAFLTYTQELISTFEKNPVKKEKI